MRSWGFWDWAGYVSLFIAALFLGLAEGLKRMPSVQLPQFLESPFWWFLPLILFVAGSAILFLRLMGWLGLPAGKFLKWPPNYKPAVIERGKTFVNQKVPLDNRCYVDCVFENVTFHYNGTTPIQMIGAHIGGSRFVASDNQAVEGAWLVAYAIGLIPAQTRLVGLDKAQNTMEPPTRLDGQSKDKAK